MRQNSGDIVSNSREGRYRRSSTAWGRVSVVPTGGPLRPCRSLPLEREYQASLLLFLANVPNGANSVLCP